jgi:hypothetical protein
MTLLYILLPLLITGMGFITYNHPEIARKISFVLLVVATWIFSAALLHNKARTMDYREIGDIIYAKIPPRDPNDHSLTVGSPYYEYANTLKYTIGRKREAIESKTSEILISGIIVIGILLGFITLSFVFNNIQNKKNVKGN